MTDTNAYLEVATAAARAAGAEIMAALERPREPRRKGFRDLVTDTDLRAERTIVETIRTHFPHHHFRTEEGSLPSTTPFDDHQADFLWFVDPLDGTTNFVHGYPLFCTSLALRHGDKTLVGVVYDPAQNHLFTAQVGHGAWLDGKRLWVSECRELGEALVALDWGRAPAVRSRSVSLVATLSPRVATLRSLGSATLALCGIAAGWLEGYFNLALYDWDVAAAELLIREAGGQVTDLRGEPWHPGMRGCLASNGHLHRELLALMNNA